MNICITGASSGIGQALAERLLSEGHAVWGVARREILLSEPAVSASRGKFFSSVCDVSSAAAVQTLFTEMGRKNFLPDAIFCAAAIFEDDLIPDYAQDLFEKTFRVNFFGVMNVVNVFLPAFLKRRAGHFIVLSSIAAFRPNRRGAAYPASKAAVGLAFRSFDLRYRKEGVSFSTVYLGPVATAMWEGKKRFIVPRPERVAPRIAKLLATKKPVQYIPFVSTALFRLSNLLPDFLYTALSKALFK